MAIIVVLAASLFGFFAALVSFLLGSGLVMALSVWWGTGLAALALIGLTALMSRAPAGSRQGTARA
ncbi:hypothetical protein [Pseudogemmobacter humi]|uniref:Uncharacterized protein n=1 Tax=Pseudogemmobacter humi TaxID=2483812 RepID=A0A3P5XIA0_9RHOB|nr:hypothetical protein [Pseudogemmobacter humi]VDC27320.1 hypothetical protein XINFAN_01860 [Pseudogemmobacter humi]